MLTRATFSVLACLLLLGSSGCGIFTEYVFVHERFPIITKPEEPTAPVISMEQLAPLDEKTRKDLIDGIVALRTYKKQIDMAVDLYNAEAEEHNKKARTKEEEKP